MIAWRTFDNANRSMTVRREHKQFGRRQTLANIPILLIGFGAFAFVLLDVEVRGLRFWISASVFVLAICWVAVFEYLRMRRFSCPACGDRLAKPDFSDFNVGDPICFTCKKCDIEWDTGLSNPDGT